MKYKLLFLLAIFSVLSCTKDDKDQFNNPFLYRPVVNVNLNLNLPQYNPLKFPGEYVIIEQGISGIVVYCANENLYLAFDLSDPNHPLSDCSRMTVEGPIATCPCESDDNRYSIVNFGQHLEDPGTKYPMQQYRVQRTGNTINITN